MKLNKPIFYLLTIIFAWTVVAATISEGLDNLLTQLEVFNNTYPQEKIHLQTDKPYYSVGEDIWFKAYVVDARQNFLSNQSKILYIDLLDDRDSVRQTLLLPVQNGLASGNLHLSDSVVSSGNYHLVAYTKWMQNFGSEYFFKKDITLVNALRGAVSGALTDQFTPTDGGGRQLNAQLAFTADNGGAYANQPVEYNIMAGNKVISNGKVVTDANGKLSLTQAIKNEYKDQPITISTLLPKPGYRGQTQNFVIRPLASVADVQFFPEGGHLISGIRTKVGFKALKPDGLGEDIEGYVIENDNYDEHVAGLHSDHAGMGVFALQPVSGKSYTAVIKHQDGSEKRYALPKADVSGYVLNVNHVGDSLSVRVSASADLVNGKEVAVIAQSNGVAEFAAKIKMDKSSNVSYVSAKKFQTGITQFTLFGPDMQPVAERLVFVDHNDGLSAGLKSDKPEYTKREKVSLNLDVRDNTGKPAIGSFSVSVTDEGKVKQNEDDETSILSNLLLTSDIKGHIEQPNYYFNPQNPNRQKHLDELLLTQGWRRFSWAELATGKFPEFSYPHEQSLMVSGSVTNMGNKPVSKSKVTLFATSKGGTVVVDTIADENGHFVFNNLAFPDSAKIMVRAGSAKNNSSVNIKTTIDKRPHITYATIRDDYQVANTGLANYLKNTQAEFTELEKSGLMKNGITLKEVVIKERKERDKFTMDKIIPHSSNIDPGSADYVIKPDILEYQTNILDAFAYVPGVYVKAGSVYPGTGSTSFSGPTPMLVIIDGAQIQSSIVPTMLAALNPKDVAGIEILTHNSKTVYGTAGHAGVLIITTKRGGEAPSVDNSFNKAHYSPQGYSTVKEFYSPAYDVTNPGKAADLRSTIYWNPNIVTDEQGHASFRFFNADGAGTYKVTLEGMDTKGGLVRKTFTYVVK